MSFAHVGDAGADVASPVFASGFVGPTPHAYRTTTSDGTTGELTETGVPSA